MWTRSSASARYIWQKDDRQAAAWYRKAAEQGQVFAQFNLGMMYFNGQGVAKDYSQAVAWSRLAAEQGHVQAQYFLGWMYTNGLGVVQDDWQALSWIRKAAEQGHVKAQVSLSAMYAQGRGRHRMSSLLTSGVRWRRSMGMPMRLITVTS